jgi:hypothetical protein
LDRLSTLDRPSRLDGLSRLDIVAGVGVGGTALLAVLEINLLSRVVNRLLVFELS